MIHAFRRTDIPFSFPQRRARELLSHFDSVVNRRRSASPPVGSHFEGTVQPLQVLGGGDFRRRQVLPLLVEEMLVIHHPGV
jgi:hypothetical protein